MMHADILAQHILETAVAKEEEDLGRIRNGPPRLKMSHSDLAKNAMGPQNWDQPQHQSCSRHYVAYHLATLRL